MRALIVLLACALAGNALAAGDCAFNSDTAEIGSRFVLKGALAYDKETRLTWQRCSAGQHYAKDRCVGTAESITLTDALQTAKRSAEGWRLPTLDELGSLVKKSCASPMINHRVFPDVREISEGMAKYWTSTRALDEPVMTYNVDFIVPGLDANSAGIPLGVRWVRDGRAPSK